MRGYVAAALMLVLLAGFASAQYGYGTSSISVQRYNVTMYNGGSIRLNYSVNLASGSTWGTTLAVTDNQRLLSQGISTTLSKTYGNPTYKGNITISVSPSTPKGYYAITLRATGDDPSARNTTINLIVSEPNSTSTIAAPANSTNVTIAPTSTTPHVSPTTTTVQATPAAPLISMQMEELLAGVAAAVIAALALTFVFKGRSTRLTIWGIALVLIGIFSWLYGDYNGFLMAYVWSGIGAVALGIIAWVAGDSMAGAYKSMEVPALLDIAGIIILIVGVLVWLYGDYYYPGSLIYIWTGVGVMLLGTLVWAVGNAMAGAFLRSKEEHKKK